MARIETPRPIRGTQDMIGETQARFAHVMAAFDRVRRLYGFSRVEVPAFEATAVFARSLGETTDVVRSEEHTSELQSLMRISYDVFCLKKKKKYINQNIN